VHVPPSPAASIELSYRVKLRRVAATQLSDSAGGKIATAIVTDVDLPLQLLRVIFMTPASPKRPQTCKLTEKSRKYIAQDELMRASSSHEHSALLSPRPRARLLQ